MPQRNTRPMTPDDERHGTPAGYSSGCRESCCREAHRLQRQAARIRAAAAGAAVVPAFSTHRRIRALNALGWTCSMISEHMGMGPNYVYDLTRCDAINNRTAGRIADVYERMSMKLPPDNRHTQQMRQQAKERGWPPPMAWDDDQIDDPNGKPVGHIPMGPDLEIRATRYHEMVHFDFLGYSLEQLCGKLHVSKDSLWKWCDREDNRAHNRAMVAWENSGCEGDRPVKEGKHLDLFNQIAERHHIKINGGIAARQRAS